MGVKHRLEPILNGYDSRSFAQPLCDVELVFLGGMWQRSFQPVKLKVVCPFPLINMNISQEQNRQIHAQQKQHEMNIMVDLGRLLSPFAPTSGQFQTCWMRQD